MRQKRTMTFQDAVAFAEAQLRPASREQYHLCQAHTYSHRLQVHRLLNGVAKLVDSDSRRLLSMRQHV